MKKPHNCLSLHVATVVVVLWCTLSGAVNANHVKCTCPNVQARATGSTSCSASESANRCTVAFNDFDFVLEQAAKKLLETYSLQSDIRYLQIPAESSNGERGFTRERAIWLRGRSPDSIVDQIMIYALVTLIQSGDYAGRRSELASVHNVLRKNNKAIGAVFSSGGSFKQDGLVVGLGCFEFRRGGLWGMYKANWSESIGKNQC